VAPGVRGAALKSVDGADANAHEDAEALREHSAVIPARSHVVAYLATHARFSAAFGADSFTSAVSDSTTMSPPFASPRKFKATFGLRLMLRIGAPGWL
jgi:hypothetical protein